MFKIRPLLPVNSKRFFNFCAFLTLPLLVALLTGCSVNPATGDRQFTALLSPAQEVQVGAEEHEKIIATFGQPKPGDPIQAYVENIGEKVAANTERPDVDYKFFVLDTPMVNAFALPGGYVYVSRGLVAQANSEAELAAVLGHEIGHITARHSAERYSQSVLTSLGSLVLATAVDSQGIARAAGLGSDLYIKSYSRGQELQADELGVRYLHKAGYAPEGMASFLTNLAEVTALEQRLSGNGPGSSFSYFSTHPQTGDRILQARAEAAGYPVIEGIINRAGHLEKVEGTIYGDSDDQGLVRGQSFYHPVMDFTFNVPEGFTINNQPDQVVAVNKGNGAAIIFDAAANPQKLDPAGFMRQVWMRGELLPDLETIDVNGMQAATASFAGTLNGQPVNIRLVTIGWDSDTIFRFQMAYPQRASNTLIEDLKRTTYSVRPMTAQEKQAIRPYRIALVTAQPGDTVASLSSRMAYVDMQAERFRVLNGLAPGENVVPGQVYKVVQ